MAIEMERVSVSYGGRVALQDVTLGIAPGQLVGIIGPNGAGKSTLLKALLGTVPLSSGRVRVLGEEPTRARRRIAYVPQREQVAWDFPITVEEVVLLGSYRRVGWLRRPGAAERAAAVESLKAVGLADRRDSQIGRLSGGQQQRVFIARALLQLGGPADLAQIGGVILLDEPMASVDAASGEVVMSVLRGLANAGCTVLMSTHDLNVAATTCDRLLLLNRHLTGFGPPAEVFTAEVLSETYGGHALLFSSGATSFGVLDDGAHHHDHAHCHIPGHDHSHPKVHAHPHTHA
jgi:manganese/iron transport system ATP-binding protein